MVYLGSESRVFRFLASWQMKDSLQILFPYVLDLVEWEELSLEIKVVQVKVKHHLT